MLDDPPPPTIKTNGDQLKTKRLQVRVRYCPALFDQSDTHSSSRFAWYCFSDGRLETSAPDDFSLDRSSRS